MTGGTAAAVDQIGLLLAVPLLDTMQHILLTVPCKTLSVRRCPRRCLNGKAAFSVGTHMIFCLGSLCGTDPCDILQSVRPLDRLIVAHSQAAAAVRVGIAVLAGFQPVAVDQVQCLADLVNIRALNADQQVAGTPLRYVRFQYRQFFRRSKAAQRQPCTKQHRGEQHRHNS